MAREIITYRIPPDGDVPGVKVRLVLTYDENNPNPNGSFTATDVHGTYTRYDATGNLSTDQITGLSSTPFKNANNHFYVGGRPFVSNRGISFTISDPTHSNNGSGDVNFSRVKGPPPGQFNEAGKNTNTASVVRETAPCFASGTSIRTARGEVRVEDLRVGDQAVTASGALRTITWIGHRELDGGGEALPHDQKIIRVRTGAFGPGLPARDLHLSPGHPVLVGADEDAAGGHLVPIMCLINGTTIERASVDRVTYWHVELDEHEILMAEGLPCESYIDLGSRQWFAGADGALYDPDMALPGMPGRCRPVAIDGPVVEAERRRLDQVFATRLEAAAAWPDAQSALLAIF